MRSGGEQQLPLFALNVSLFNPEWLLQSVLGCGSAHGYLIVTPSQPHI